MPRPPRRLSPRILNTLAQRPKLRYTLTSKGAKALESGDVAHEDALSSLVEAIDSNNGQPVPLATWKKFHEPKRVTNDMLKDSVTNQIISLVSRSKFTFAERDK